MSHPTGVRGLKSPLFAEVRQLVTSHPTGVRGLKSATGPVYSNGRTVAPHWGAWIEIDTRCPQRRS